MLSCEECNTRIEQCSFCDKPARHLLGANVLVQMVEVASTPEKPESFGDRRDATIYICEEHEDMFDQSLHDGEYRDPKVELGMYNPSEDCTVCDPWA